MIAFDIELTMGGIFTFLENSIGQYAPNIIKAFRTIGDDNDADILEKICHFLPPSIMRAEFLSGSHKEFEITTFQAEHPDLSNETVKIIEDIAENLYINTDFDIWELLCQYLDQQISSL